jgi:hypothetical protein
MKNRIVITLALLYTVLVWVGLVWFTWTGSPVAAYNMGTQYIANGQLCYPTTYPDRRTLPLKCFPVNPHWLHTHGG